MEPAIHPTFEALDPNPLERTLIAAYDIAREAATLMDDSCYSTQRQSISRGTLEALRLAMDTLNLPVFSDTLLIAGLLAEWLYDSAALCPDSYLTLAPREAYAAARLWRGV